MNFQPFTSIIYRFVKGACTGRGHERWRDRQCTAHSPPPCGPSRLLGAQMGLGFGGNGRLINCFFEITVDWWSLLKHVGTFLKFFIFESPNPCQDTHLGMWTTFCVSSVEVQHKKIPVFCSSFQLVVFKTYRYLVSWKHRSRLHGEAAGVQGFRRSLWFPECHGVPCEGRGVETNEFPWPRQDLQWQVPTWQWNHASSSLHRNLCFHWGLVVGRCRFLLGSCTAFLFRLEHEALSTLQHFTFHPWFWCNFFLSWSTLQICSGWARDSFLMARHHLLSSLPKCGFLCEPCAGASLNASSAMLHRLRLLPPSRAALTWTLGSDSCDAHGNMHHLWLQHLQCQ